MPDIAGVVFWVWHIREGVCCVSQGFDRMLQVDDLQDRARIEATWWRSRIHEEDMPDMLRVERDIRENRIVSYDVLIRIRTMENCWLWCNGKGQVTERDGTEPVVVSGVMINISKLRADSKFQQAGAGGGGHQLPRHA